MAFFHVIQQKRPDKKLLSERTARELGCKVCTLDKVDMKHPKLPPSGSPDPVIYFMGENTTDSDDYKGEPFRGNSGELVRKLLPSKWKSKSRWGNIIRCVKGTPSAHEILCCRSLQERDIAESQPNAIVGFGNGPLNWFTGYSGPTVWAGRKMPMHVAGHSFWFYPMFSPAYVLHQQQGYGGEEILRVFEHHMQQFFKDAEEGFPIPDVVMPQDAAKGVKTAEHMNVGDIIAYLKKHLKKHKAPALDWETKGLRPYYKGNIILSAAVGTFDDTFSFPIGHPEAGISERDQKLILQVLSEGLAECDKVWAHNAKFEQEWMINKVSEEITRRIKWGDTMAQAYTLDERKGAKGLDEVTMLHYGIRVKGLSLLDKSNLDKEPLANVLRYGGMDVKFTEGVARKQSAILFKQKLTSVSLMNQRRTLTMALVQAKGVLPNVEEAKAIKGKLEKDITDIFQQIYALPEVKDYERRYKHFEPLNPHHASKMFKTHLGMYHLESVDEEALSSVNHPLAKLILEARPLAKILSTYVNKISEGTIICPDGLIHAQFNNLYTSTGRLNSDDPNMQNFPKRKHKYVRNCIGVPKGYYIVAFDMGQIEARMIGMMSRDPFLCKALWTGYDIHGHWTDKIGKAYPKWGGNLSDKKWRKDRRDHVKNEWTFPNFFGAQLDSVAGYLGIPSRVLEPLYEEFWDQFSGVRAWQQELVSFYRRHLYIETLTGRRRHGPMSINELFNSGVQGGASDITVDSMEDLTNMAFEREEPWLTPIMNVHDDLTFYLPKGSKGDDACELIGKRMCLSPYKFINVPLVVEMSADATGWGNLEEVCEFRSTDYPEGKRYETQSKR